MKPEDESAATQPILTDLAMGSWDATRTQLNSSYAGLHQWPAYFARNMNLLFVDGHVETRSKNRIKWQIELSGGNVIPY
jgi:prepilin-type processing-associated H-X9-DG protein